MRSVGVLAVLLLLAGCATRRIEGCLVGLTMLGPGSVVIDCRPPLGAATDQDQ
jgi:hypothetical protein